ncbi:MAG: hypothetical protein ACI4TK_07900 [Agathobacter sp.]
MKHNIYDKVLVHSIVLALSNFGWNDLPKKELLLNSITWLHEKYKQDGEKAHLYKAINHAYAFLQLGFEYEQGKEIFEPIVEELGITVEEVFPAREWVYKKMALTKCNIRNVLNRWNPKLHSMKSQDVVDDIYDNIRYKRLGEYLYHSGKVLCQDGEKVLWENTYWLYVREDRNVFYNVNLNKYYTFE